MGFKRAEWRSGLTYQQVCKTCNNVMTYMDDKLDFRPWYPDGFVYCTVCKTPLRHNENYAINRPYTPTPTYSAPMYTPPASGVNVSAVAFCSNCGRKFNDGEIFCPTCGRKRQ